jgi:hypothetical protein
MPKKFLPQILLITVLMAGMTNGAFASDKISVNTGVDFYNRYVWRGVDIAPTPSIQPTLSVTFCNLELGAWGAYSFSNDTSVIDEIDFWLSYTLELKNGISFTLLATDYYFPNAGIKFFNFNDYDAADPGAHTIEPGLSISGSPSFPLTLSGYMNVYNDAGNNAYFQLDYPVTVGETELGLFCGFAGGSKDNPDYYGTDKLNAINLGLTAHREIMVSESFSLPLAVSLIVNPRAEISYLLVGMSF